MSVKIDAADRQPDVSVRIDVSDWQPDVSVRLDVIGRHMSGL